MPEKSGCALLRRAIRLSRSSCLTERDVYPLERSSAIVSGFPMPTMRRGGSGVNSTGAARDLTCVARVSMLPHMSNTPIARFDDLLSTRARIGRGGPAAPTRPVVNALYEFGGGFPDPASFPYEGI